MHRRDITGLIMAVIFVVVTGILFSDREPAGDMTETADTAAMQTQETVAAADTAAETEASQIYVYVCGAVEHPDVYALPCDARAYLAVEAAGGVTPGADTAALNLAQKLSDGERLYVPESGETANGFEAYKDSRVDLNQADAAALMTLPGIGEAKAAAIIAYRDQHGPFKEIDDLLGVPGIKEGTLSGLRDMVRVE